MRVNEIAASLQGNLTQKAILQAELFVRDYGTHVVSKAKVGARAEREDFVELSASDMRNSSVTQMRAAATASFLWKLKLGASYDEGRNVSEEGRQILSSRKRDSQTRTQGGSSLHRLASSNSSRNEPRQTAFNSELACLRFRRR